MRRLSATPARCQEPPQRGSPEVENLGTWERRRPGGMFIDVLPAGRRRPRDAPDFHMRRVSPLISGMLFGCLGEK